MKCLISVTQVKPQSYIPLVHTLAAPKSISELNGGRALSRVVGYVAASDDEIRRAAAR